MDLTESIAPTSDQLDAVDLLAGPRTFTITGVSKGNSEQPVNISLAEFPRVWRPGKSMRRVLVACWGPDASQYVGRHVTLYCDPEVAFGGKKVGGTRISHLSGIDKAKTVPLLVSRGQSAMFTVQPLKDVPAPTPQQPAGPTPDDVAGCNSIDELRAMYRAATAEVKELIKARVDELQAAEFAEPEDGALIPGGAK